MDYSDIAAFGDIFADVYDEWFNPPADDAADGLAALAGAGPALELGIGTGRVALALAARGVPVHGIDGSMAMVDRLRAKPGGDQIAVTIGDFAEVDVTGEFPLIFVVMGTLFCLLTQEDQLRCFVNAANHLTGDGVFVVEAWIPDPERFTLGQSTMVTDIEAEEVQLLVARRNQITQRISSQQVSLSEKGVRLYPFEARYAWPSELDLMARLAGLGLKERWSDWHKSGFTPKSGNHISIYGRANT